MVHQIITGWSLKKIRQKKPTSNIFKIYELINAHEKLSKSWILVLWPLRPVVKNSVDHVEAMSMVHHVITSDTKELGIK